MISSRGRNRLHEFRKAILHYQNVFERLVASLEPLLNIKKVVMNNLVRCSSVYFLSHRSRDKWFVIDGMQVPQKHLISSSNDSQRKYSEILLFVPSKDR